MIWAFFVVVAIVAGVICYLGAKMWPTWHVVVLFFLLVSLSGLFVLASMVLKTHKEWREEIASLEKNVLSAQQTVDKLENRNSLLLGSDAIQSVPGATTALTGLVMDRGRVWRNASLSGIQDGRVTLDMTKWGNQRCARVGMGDEEEMEPEPDPVADGDAGEGDAPAAAPAAPATHQISASMVLYAFLEVPVTEINEARRTALFGANSGLIEKDTKGACKLPTVFVGDFRVAEVNGNDVVVSPLSPVDEQVLADSQDGTWALYELMPLDGHSVFADVGDLVVDADDEGGAVADLINARREALMALIPQESMTGLGADQYNELINRYARDLTRADEGDPPTETRTHVRFTREHTIDVDLEDAESGADASYDPSGRAQLPHLRHGSAITYESGDEQYFDTITAQRLIRDGICEATDKPRLYARPLVDYVMFFHRNRSEQDRLANQIATLATDSGDVIAAAKKVESQIAYRAREVEKLKSDQQNLKREVAALNAIVTDLQMQRERQKVEITDLYHMNRSFEQELRGALRFGSTEAAARR